MVPFFAYFCQSKEPHFESSSNYVTDEKDSIFTNIGDSTLLISTLKNRSVENYRVTADSLLCGTSCRIDSFVGLATENYDTLYYLFTNSSDTSIIFKSPDRDHRIILVETYSKNVLVSLRTISLQEGITINYSKDSFSTEEYFFGIYMAHRDLRVKNKIHSVWLGVVNGSIGTNSVVTCYTPNGTGAANTCARESAKDRCPGGSICIDLSNSSTSGPDANGTFTGTCTYSCGTC